MRFLAIGDIHGCLKSFDTLLSAIKLTQEDTLITLGDYVDRGSDSKGVIERILAIKKEHHLITLRGNHEVMLLKARNDQKSFDDWIVNGGDSTIASYGGFNLIPQSHWDFLSNDCIDLWEMETHFFVHAGVYPDLALYEQPEYALHWKRFSNPQPHNSGKIMVCGHTSQKTGFPLNLGYAICIDTWAYGEGWLTCLDVNQGMIWQTNEAGKLRQLSLNQL